MVFSSLVLWAGCPGAQAGYQMPDRIRHDDRAGRPQIIANKKPAGTAKRVREFLLRFSCIYLAPAS